MCIHGPNKDNMQFRLHTFLSVIENESSLGEMDDATTRAALHISSAYNYATVQLNRLRRNSTRFVFFSSWFLVFLKARFFVVRRDTSLTRREIHIFCCISQ